MLVLSPSRRKYLVLRPVTTSHPNKFYERVLHRVPVYLLLYTRTVPALRVKMYVRL